MNPSAMLDDLEPITRVTVPSALVLLARRAAPELPEVPVLPEPLELQAASAARSATPIPPTTTADFLVRAMSHPPRTQSEAGCRRSGTRPRRPWLERGDEAGRGHVGRVHL